MQDEVREYFALNAELRKLKEQYEAYIEPKKTRWQELRTLLFQRLKETGQSTAKFTGAGTVSIAIEKKPVVTNERAVVGWLKAKGLTDYYSTEPHLTELFYESVLPSIKNGEVEVPIGIEFQEKESLKTLAEKSEPSSAETETKQEA